MRLPRDRPGCLNDTASYWTLTSHGEQTIRLRSDGPRNGIAKAVVRGQARTLNARTEAWVASRRDERDWQRHPATPLTVCLVARDR
jgi:hypothetical protein